MLSCEQAKVVEASRRPGRGPWRARGRDEVVNETMRKMTSRIPRTGCIPSHCGAHRPPQVRATPSATLLLSFFLLPPLLLSPRNCPPLPFLAPILPPSSPSAPALFRPGLVSHASPFSLTLSLSPSLPCSLPLSLISFFLRIFLTAGTRSWPSLAAMRKGKGKGRRKGWGGRVTSRMIGHGVSSS